jgi:hypothetical protein
MLEELAVAGNTAELKAQLGAPLEVTAETAEKERNLLKEVVEKKKTKNLTNQTTAFAAATFLRTYGAALALDVSQVRAAVTNKLMEIANCGEPRYELKALELLGKHSDVGLFTERSEITINYQNPEDLEKAIKERVKRLLNADVIDITPLGADLDEEFGIANIAHQEDITDIEVEDGAERE